MACGLAYDAGAAKAHVDKLWAELNALKASLAGEITPDVAHAAVTQYRTLPTFMPNWSLAGVAEADAQHLADEIRTTINNANARLGSNVMPLQRAFGAK